MLRLSLLLAVFAVSAPLAAQPDPAALLRDWARAQAAAGQTVSLDESLVRRMSGPRGTVRVETESRVHLTPNDRPRRDVRRARLDGDAISAERADDFGTRMGRAFGPGGREVAGPPDAPARFLGRARATGIAADRLDGASVWRVALRPPPPPGRAGRADRPRRPRGGRPGSRPGRRSRGGERRSRADRPAPDRFTAWFSADGARLLRLRVEGSRPGGSVEREVRYQRVGGLDVPRTASARASLQQRRRLRVYAVDLVSEATYTVAR